MNSEEPDELNTNQKIVLISSFLLLFIAIYFILSGNSWIFKGKGKGKKKRKI